MLGIILIVLLALLLIGLFVPRFGFMRGWGWGGGFGPFGLIGALLVLFLILWLLDVI